MRKIKFRANSALLIGFMIVVGLCVYLIRLADHGADWAMFSGNLGLYKNGILNTGRVADRNGVVLAWAGDGKYGYADDETTRRACLHVVGDYPGNIGTGVITSMADKIAGYSFMDGTYSRDGGGSTLRLTIDSDVCRTAYTALSGRSGAVLVSNYETGEIICMVSSAGFDPAYQSASGAPAPASGAYLNKAISSTYTPGSVFKIVTLAAALENIDGLYKRTFDCSGIVTIGYERINCSGVHGRQTIEEAFANSCNSAFAVLSAELGPDTLAKYAESYGLTSSHSIDGIETAAGRFDKAEPDSGALAWSGIGQYNDLASPYSFLRLSTAIANKGQAAESTLVSSYPLPANSQAGLNKPVIMRESTAVSLADMMSYNIIYSYGRDRFPGLDIYAKTGTAEVSNGYPHAWFTGFIKNPGHPLAFTVVVENGGSGLSAAGSVANAVLQAAVGN